LFLQLITCNHPAFTGQSILMAEVIQASTNLRGTSVAQGDNQVSFDTSSLAAGIYLYQLSDAGNTIQTGKIVVTK